MDRKILNLINSFAELGARLATFGTDTESDRAIREATQANAWFTANDVSRAVEAITRHMLDRDRLIDWLAPYDLAPSPDTSVGIIMAGNIPLVGFFDLLCVVASGRQAHIKQSSKDSILISYIVGLLKEIDPDIPIYDYNRGGRLDAIIATGSDNTNRYFRAEFSNIPSLLRGSRYSVAVVNGTETVAQLQALANDIFTYSGLGCRNVSKLLVPRGYDFAPLCDALSSYRGINPKYRNNYLQNRALLTMNRQTFVDGGFFTLRAEADNSLYISELSYSFYDSPNSLTEWLSLRDHELQCVVCGAEIHPRAVAFGGAQSPSLTDYPDAVDVIEFIKKV